MWLGGGGEAAETSQALSPQLGPQLLDQILRRGAGFRALGPPLGRRQRVGKAGRSVGLPRCQQQTSIGGDEQLRHGLDRARMPDLRLAQA